MIYAPTRDRYVLPVSTAVEPVEPTVSATVFEIFTLKDRKTADFSHPSLV